MKRENLRYETSKMLILLGYMPHNPCLSFFIKRQIGKTKLKPSLFLCVIGIS
jgi:hypothetical protein